MCWCLTDGHGNTAVVTQSNLNHVICSFSNRLFIYPENEDIWKETLILLTMHSSFFFNCQ